MMRGMPEGHTIHRLAREHAQLFKGRTVRASSPQGRFVEGAAQLDGRTFTGTDAYGKHLFWRFEGNRRCTSTSGSTASSPAGRARARAVRRAAPAHRGRRRLPRSARADRLRADHAARALGDLRAPRPRPAAPRRRRRAGVEPDRAQRGAHGDDLLSTRRSWPASATSTGPSCCYRHGVSPHRIGRELGRERWDAFWLDLRRLMQNGVRGGRIVTTEPADRDRRSGTARREDALYVYRRRACPAAAAAPR